MLTTRSPLIGEIIGFGLSGVLCGATVMIGDVDMGGWPCVFYIFGFLGILWYPLWLWLAYESPYDHPTITQEEINFINCPENREKNDDPNNISKPFLADSEDNILSSTAADKDQDKLDYDEYADVDTTHGMIHGTVSYRSRQPSRISSLDPEIPTLKAFHSQAESLNGKKHIGHTKPDLFGESVSVGAAPVKRVRRRAPWDVFFSNPATLVLLVASWTYGWIGFMLISEMPTYLQDELGRFVTQY